MNVRLLPYAVASGPHNMAADETLLESAGLGIASLRFYGWDSATVTLGYFQRETCRRDQPRLAHLPFVRRSSGGGALVHHHEVTYCLALTAGRPWQGGEPWLCRMHRIIAMALGDFGVAANLQPTGQERRIGPTLCFQHFTPGDLVVADAKIVGSAQRRQRGALMQHGGILLTGSEHTPTLPGIRELAGKSLEAAQLCDAVVRHFTATTGWRLIPDSWTEDESQRKNELARAKYSSDAWNFKR